MMIMRDLRSIKTYSDLVKLNTFTERFDYLKLKGIVGKDTFGFDRYLNQRFYNNSALWKSVRDKVIIRDNGCDLAIPDRSILGKIVVHHMNPITVDDIINQTDFLYNPDFLICVSHNTHNAIHYGDSGLLILNPIERSKDDTCPWKH